jgi:hypothetical protein
VPVGVTSHFTSSKSIARCASRARRRGGCGWRSRRSEGASSTRARSARCGWSRSRARVVRGTAGSSTARSTRRGPEAALALAGSGATAVPERIRLATPRCGSSPRASATRSSRVGRQHARRPRRARGALGVEVAITGGVLLDPVLGVRHASIGISGGRVVSVGRAGNPTRWTASTSCSTPPRRSTTPRGCSSRPAAWTPTCTGCRPRWPTPRSPAGLTTLVIQDPGPVWNLGCNPPSSCARRGRRSTPTRSTPRCSCGPRPRARARSSTRCGRAGRA